MGCVFYPIVMKRILFVHASLMESIVFTEVNFHGGFT